ncbi:DUF4290 domain-containing protein [Hymenobacter sp. BT186]|uniref:DUF4290 domain-containing protein n=1 Tax=Hymenobacter telluris TaxID=2816474 RepID=A0A939JD84_9BACT|nr:DUF4290 domain-containing protein [Hymenobacter telluris]MBO0360986.1 DUF4290 domain-containing protein [Hymenobacter telluris]MBW3377014.1 DUF4290 domain-containing protein [Hymenobacter norwichensis]
MPLPSLHKHELLQREYGQSTYQLVQGLREVEDKTERTRRATQIVQLIFRLQPSLRDQPDAQQRVWNHLYEMADEDLDIDAPFELKGLSQLNQQPKPLPYPKLSPKLKAYGRSVELMVEKALTLEDPTEREQATVTIGRTMKFLYRSHNKENAKDVTILKHLKDLSGGQLTLDPAQVEAQGLFEFATGPAAATTGGSGRAAFIVPQPRQERDRDGRRGNNGGGGNRRDKQRRGGKKGRQEPQQPPQ